MQLVKGKLVPARDQPPEPRGQTDLWASESFPRSHRSDQWMCWDTEQSPGASRAQVGSSPSLPQRGLTANLSSPGQVAACASFPSPNSHYLMNYPRAHPGYTAHPSWAELPGTMGRADLHRNPGNNHILLICAHPIMLPALFLGFGSKYTAALTTSTFFTKDSVIKYSRLQHTINQSSLPVWICNSAVWKHLGTISAQILLDKGQIYFLLNQMLFDWIWFIDKSDRVF